MDGKVRWKKEVKNWNILREGKKKLDNEIW